MDPFTLLALAVCFAAGKWQKSYGLFVMCMIGYCVIVYVIVSLMLSKAKIGGASIMAIAAVFVLGNLAYGAGRIASRFWPPEK